MFSTFRLELSIPNFYTFHPIRIETAISPENNSYTLSDCGGIFGMLIWSSFCITFLSLPLKCRQSSFYPSFVSECQMNECFSVLTRSNCTTPFTGSETEKHVAIGYEEVM